MKDKFSIRAYKNADGKSPISLHLSGDYKRERIPLNINVNSKEWDLKKERLIPLSTENQDINLILDNIKSKITKIKTSYRLAERVLTPESLRKEFLNGMPRIRFTAFYDMMLEEEKSMMQIGSYNRYKSVLRKLKIYDDDVTFMDIDLNWIDKFKKYLRSLDNASTTIANNTAALKKFLGLAQKAGIKLSINIDEIEVGSTKGNRTSLSVHELKRCAEYYFGDEISDSYRLILGYFLFSCMTGLRISDVQRLKRSNFMDNYVTFIAKKTRKDQSIAMNVKAREIVDHEPLLFEKKFADQHINDELKKIMLKLKINKRVTFHVARHTFATSFLRAGGQIEKLQRLLGHSDIGQTMIYSHIVQADANAEIFLIDTLF
ncbi:site-specific integrase [Flavobacterium taihuense]|uniref:Site-specific integrase n=1 Tax=Flavobacterium taihuense TaxID=2857508 RepID=A0ABS6Y0P7_9FLAO|nr:site-specific integrase [Flavobacterium taihuense]MBW4362503.1 site-specific integrase [Flavobacterium taihuense]